jgi:hypothetical protein
VVGAFAAARELPQLSLVKALDLTLLPVARKDLRRHQRIATRWLRRTSRKILRFLNDPAMLFVEDHEHA